MGDFLKTVDLGTGFNATGITYGCWNWHTCVYDDNVPNLNALKCYGSNGVSLHFLLCIRAMKGYIVSLC